MQLDDYTDYEYVITAGEGKMIAHGIASRPRLRQLVDNALLDNGDISVMCDVAIPSTETGKIYYTISDQVHK